MRVVLHAPVGGERPSNPCGKACFGNLGAAHMCGWSALRPPVRLRSRLLVADCPTARLVRYTGFSR
jgi:hypothetical protein